jgi:ribose transport system ATP-binding protein
MRGISKHFPGVIALDKVNLEVHPGEVIAIIGENGAGKSTMMKIMGGVYQPDGGEIFVDGKPVTIANPAAATKFGVGFIHQELNVLDNLDVAANVFLGREPLQKGIGGMLRLFDRVPMETETAKYLERLGLDIGPRTPLSQLSIAEQQMVEIAKVLSQEARVVIMDEPTSSLTLSETQRLLQIVKELRAQGVGILYISHRLGEVVEIADRVVGFRDGKNAGGLRRDEIDHERMVRLMVGRDIDRFRTHNSASQGGEYAQVRGLKTRRYPDKEVTFSVARGEILGFAGLVGAGRSEMAQAVFGVEPPLGGQIILDGKPLSIKRAADAIKAGIYLIPEDRRHSGLLVDMSIRENISLPALNRYASAGIINSGRERANAETQSKALGVKTPNVEVRAGNLSGGNQQKVVLAKWLSLEPKLIIFDEPTRGIDVGAKAEIYTLMENLAKSGVAIVMISSDMEEVLNVSDRVAVMHEGRITGFLSREESSEEAIMRLAVGGSEHHDEIGAPAGVVAST